VDFTISDTQQTAPLPYNPTGAQGSAGATGQQGVTTTVTTLTSAINTGSQDKTPSGLSSSAGQQSMAQAPSGPCRDGQTTCKGKCTDLNTDLTNCGVCGNYCPAGHGVDCIKGTCGCTDPSLSYSDGICVNLKTDSNNCGSRDNICNLGGVPDGQQRCDNGICACPSGKTSCNGNCVDLKTDLNNCGTCGNGCKTTIPHSHAACRVFGSCAWDCDAGYTKYYSGSTKGCYTDSEIAALTTPAASNPCAGHVNGALANWVNCDGTCVNLINNNNNCGACGLHCPTGTICTGPLVCCNPLFGCGPAL
jgi:hypothetical protein